ncbi:MAG: signal peptidase I [Dehalococcoidia bacterium]
MDRWSQWPGKIATAGKYAISPVAVLLLALSYLGLLLILGTASPFLVVRGVSMVPTYQNGDLLLNRSILPTEIAVGDVIAFEVPEESRSKLKLAPVVAHRVIGIEGAGGQLVFATKGDNTEIDPFKVPASLVRGIIVSDLGPLGHLILFLSNKKIWLYVGLPLLVFGVVVVATLALSPRQKAEVETPPVPPEPATRVPSAAEARKLIPQFTQRRTPTSKIKGVPRTQKAMVKNLQEATEELRRVISGSPKTSTALLQAMRQQDQVLSQLKSYVNDPRDLQQSEELEQAINSYTQALGELEGLTKSGSEG